MTLVAHLLAIAAVVLNVPLLVAVGVFAAQIAAQARSGARANSEPAGDRKSVV